MNCYGCLKPIQQSLQYCPSCSKELFNSRKIKSLSFDKKEFYAKRQELHTSMSISGVQDKISLRFSETTGELEPATKNGQYILKPLPSGSTLKNIDDIVANEHISMQISRQVFKIDTALSALIEFSNGELAYITRRFDQTSDFQNRLDQEDLASALQYTPESHDKNYKYASSYEQCAQAIKQYVPAYRPALEELFRRVLLNYLIGNGDAHLKNFSFYFPQGRSDRVLAPSYDVLFTRYHVDDHDMAMDLFTDDYETISYKALGYETLQDFEEFATRLSIPDKRIKKIFADLIDNTDDVMRLIDLSYLSVKSKRAYKAMYEERLYKRVLVSPKQLYSSTLLEPLISKRLLLSRQD